MNFDPDHIVKQNFLHIFKMYGVPNRILEIGSFEGMTTVWLSDTLTNYNSKLQIYAVDPHYGSSDLTEFNFDIIKSNFLHNININKNKNIVYISKPSTQALLELQQQDFHPEFIYIDGNHTAHQVLVDLVLSWIILPKDGVILCDDSVNWKFYDQDNKFALQNSPRIAIDYFIHCYFDKVTILQIPNSNQIAFRKLVD